MLLFIYRISVKKGLRRGKLFVLKRGHSFAQNISVGGVSGLPPGPQRQNISN